MCIIIYKQRGQALPSKQFLQRCWTANPDGGGFAYNDNKNVYYKKGFKSFKDFYNELVNVDMQKQLVNKDLVIHFRIATSGGISPEKTHPFEITTSYKKMEQLAGTCKSAFFHNGIMADFASTLHSDTQNYTAMILANVKNLEKQEVLVDYMARVENSRFAIITKDKVMLGNDFYIDNNMQVSNKNYTYYYNTNYNYYDKTKYSYFLDRKKSQYIYDDYNKIYEEEY